MMKPECGYQPTPPPRIARGGHRLAKLSGEPHLDRTAVNMLAVFGDPKDRAGRYRAVKSSDRGFVGLDGGSTCLDIIFSEISSFLGVRF